MMINVTPSVMDEAKREIPPIIRVLNRASNIWARHQVWSATLDACREVSVKQKKKLY